MSLDEILVNEGLIKFEVSKTKRLWNRGVNKVQTLIKDRHFTDSIITVDLKGFQFSMVDNSYRTQVALLSLAINDLKVKLKSACFANMKNAMMNEWFLLNAIEKDFFNLAVNFDLSGVYYNRNTFAEEPFIERYPMALRIK
jgi:hypothetical protein